MLLVVQAVVLVIAFTLFAPGVQLVVSPEEDNTAAVDVYYGTPLPV